MPESTITITFGDCAENHVNMQKIGSAGTEGFTLQDLKRARRVMREMNAKCELYHLNQALDTGTEADDAYVLIIRNGVQHLLCDYEKDKYDMHAELERFEWDKQAIMYGRLVNKHARHNVCFADHSQKPDLEHGKGTIIPFKRVSCMQMIRQELPLLLGPKAENLVAEGNLYYDTSKTGISAHGDSERTVVVALRLGNDMPLHFNWYQNSKPVGRRIRFSLSNGDMYIMSAKAVGTDWKKRKILTLRHMAGAAKYLADK